MIKQYVFSMAGLYDKPCFSTLEIMIGCQHMSTDA